MEPPTDVCVMRSIVMNLLALQLVEFGPMVAIVVVAQIILMMRHHRLYHHHLLREVLLVMIQLVTLVELQIHVCVPLISASNLFVKLQMEYGLQLVAPVALATSFVMMMKHGHG